MKLRIRHRTTYRYTQNVDFGPHTMMLRPREGHDVHIEQSVLQISPAHRIDWFRDVYGNCLAVAQFSQSAKELMIFSDVVLNHFESNPLDVYTEKGASKYPFAYKPETSLELSTLMQPVYTNDSLLVQQWLMQFWHPGQTKDTLALLREVNEYIYRTFRYQVRYEAGVQSPLQTMTKQSGSCRDFATLFIEACRCLGFGARFVSGYIVSGGATGPGASMHAWAEVYLPGVGWKGFDPTLGRLAMSEHVPVAVSRHPENVMPISGSFIGPVNAFLNIEVDVHVETLGVQNHTLSTSQGALLNHEARSRTGTRYRQSLVLR